MSLAVFFFLAGEFWVTTTELVIRYVSIYVLFIQVLHIGFVGKASVGGDDDLFFI